MRRRSEAVLVLLLMLLVAGLFMQAPCHGEFAWSDAPRHALNGVFVKDFAVTLPWRDPSGYAYRYYAQYPALTILFYPPLFYLISAPFYAIFGFSHVTALAVVGLHYAAFALGCYALARRWFASMPAAILAACIVCLPELAFWGRQLMLELPAFAFLIWSISFFLNYLDDRKPKHLYIAAALLVLAMYTKITVGFIAIAYLASLLYVQRADAWRNRSHFIVAVGSVLALVPLVVLTVKFGQANVQSVAGVADSLVSRTTLAGWLWYARQLSQQMGWPALLASVAGCALLFRRDSAPKAALFFLGAWFVSGYIFFSAIDLKEARHSIFILPPLLLLGALGIRGLAARAAWLPVAIFAAVLAATAWHTVLHRPVLYVDGYREAAGFIAEVAPPKSAVLFSGYRDGAFIFNMRTHENRRDLSTVRADKLLLKVAVRRELGVEQKDYSEEEIVHMIDAAGIHYVVAQQDFWIDLEAMRRLQHVLSSRHFTEVKRIETRANYPVDDKVLVIYRNDGHVAERGASMAIDLPIINRTIQAEQP